MTRIYAINSQAMLRSNRRFVDALKAALDGGIDWFQLRDKRSDAEARRSLAEQALQCCAAAGVPLIINDDVELARTIGAQGVHVGQTDTAVARARAMLGPQALIGCSCHDRYELAAKAIEAGASYVAFGRLFASRTKPDAPAADLDYVRQHIARPTVPACVIGGINPANAPQAVATGAQLLAAVDSIFGAADIRHAVRQLRRAIDHPNASSARVS